MPNHIIVRRDDSGADPPGFEETEDYVAMDGAPTQPLTHPPPQITLNS